MRFSCPDRILFGPLYTGSILGRWFGHPNIRTFNAARAVTMSERHPLRPLQADIHYDQQQDDFGAILAALPPGWEPDLVVWYNLGLYGVPPGIEDCPYPTLAIVHDAHLNLATLLDYAQAFDFVVADKRFVEILTRQGFRNAAYWPCYAHDPTRHYLLPGLERPYDVVFPGNLSYHFHGSRNRWLQRLSRLNQKYRILISDRVYGDAYLRLLNQSKLVFNYSIRSEMNMRVYEAAACGAVVLCEADNAEIGDFLVDGESCVLYDEDNFEAKIDYYLAHDAERQSIAANGVQVMSTQDCEHQFKRLLELLPRVRQAFADGSGRRFRQAPASWKKLLRELQFAKSRTSRPQPPGLAELTSESEQLPPGQAAHLQAVAAAMVLERSWNAMHLLQPGPLPPEASQAVQALEAAVRSLPGHFWHAYNLACGYTLLRQAPQALSLWAQLIPGLQSLIGVTDFDSASLSWLEQAATEPFSYLWDSTAGTSLQMTLAAVLAGREPPAALYRLMLHQACELSGYCLIWLQQPEAAIQVFLEAESLGPASYFTYTPLLRLLQQTGKQAELEACVQRAAEQMGLLESHQRDLIAVLSRRSDKAALRMALADYRQLLSRFEGGGPKASESLQSWIPGLLAWIPELLEQRFDLDV